MRRDDKTHTDIRKFREKTGLSQAMMAEELGIGRTTYINFEKGNVRLFSKTLTKFAEYLGMTEEEVIFSGYGPADELLKDRRSFEDEKRAVVEDYENRLSAANEKIRSLYEIIKAHELTIKTLIEANSFLMARLRDE